MCIHGSFLKDLCSRCLLKSSSVFDCPCRLLEDQGRAEEAAELRQGVLAPRSIQGGCWQPKSGIRPGPPQLGESSPALHELVQQALTLGRKHREILGLTKWKDRDMSFE